MVAQPRHDGMSGQDIQRVFRTFNATPPEYASVPDLAVEEQHSPRAGRETRPERPA
ncbi:hypothetical protein ACIQ8G_10445 [Streptomyces sp. NPDC094154]|uniref:hypothetical protein n=1 Tax=unclassified Streptomyces TaxID=2593676 RepID=UPI00380273CD